MPPHPPGHSLETLVQPVDGLRSVTHRTPGTGPVKVAETRASLLWGLCLLSGQVAGTVLFFGRVNLTPFAELLTEMGKALLDL